MLRTSVALVAAIMLAAGATPIFPSSPALAGANPAIDECRVLLPNLPASNLGKCASYITVVANDSDGEASHACTWLQDNDPFTFELLFATRSECIQAFGSRGHFK